MTDLPPKKSRRDLIDLGNNVLVPEERLQRDVEMYRSGAERWPRKYGPPPGKPGCRLPPNLTTRGISFSGGRPRVTFHLLDGIPPMPLRNDLVSGLFQPGEFVLLVGAPKAGKSALAVHLAHVVASGGSFLGRPTRRVAVAYAALERSKETVRRLRAIGSDGLPIFVSYDRPALEDEADLAALIEALKGAAAALRPDLPLGLIIIDTARKAFRGLRENDSDSISVGLEAIRRLMRAVPSAAVVLIHHLSKDGSSARGSGAILADADLELTVASRGGRRSVEVTGANAVEEGQSLPFEIAAVMDADGSPVVAVRPAVSPQPLRVEASGLKTAPLPRDAATALDALIHLAGRGSVEIEAWRQMTFERWSDRRQGTRRQAFSKARDVLS